MSSAFPYVLRVSSRIFSKWSIVPMRSYRLDSLLAKSILTIERVEEACATRSSNDPLDDRIRSFAVPFG